MLSYPYRKGTSFSQLTLYRYAATMLLYHGLHIEHSQPIAFHIVQITRGYAVESVSYTHLDVYKRQARYYRR